MSVITEIARVLRDQFVALILDNEVTVGEFVVQPPLPWLRLVQENGVFRAGAGAIPTVLSAAASQVRDEELGSGFLGRASKVL